MSLRVRSAEIEGLAKRDFGFAPMAERGLRGAQMVEIGRVGALDRHRAQDRFDGLGVAPGLIRGHAQQMPRVGVPRFGLDDLAIDPFGLRQLTV